MHKVKLVFTVSAKDEIPLEFIKSCGWQVVTAKALRSGILSKVLENRRSSILFVVTGVGKERTIEAAVSICQFLSPLAVVNIGSCGLNTITSQEEGTVFIASKTLADGKWRQCLPQPPFALPKKIKITKTPVQTLLRPLFHKTPCICQVVDMEAGYQHDIFEAHNIPFCAIKIPTDTCSSSSRLQFARNVSRVRNIIKDILGFLTLSAKDMDISVVIPVHNRPDFIERAIGSAISQSHRPKEIIVVDDGSQPPVSTLLGSSLKEKVRIIRLPDNRGVAASRNAGIREASGKWIALLDSDDQWTRDKLRNQANYIENNPFFEILQCQEIWIRNGVRVNMCKHHEKREGWIWEKSIRLCAISPSAVIATKELLLDFGLFQEEFPACEDYELWLRITRKKPVGLNPEADLIKYGGHADQLSVRFPAMDRFRVAALLRALEEEESHVHRYKLTTSLKERLEILYNGALKRKKTDAANVYQKILGAIEKNEAVSWNKYPLLIQKFT